MPDKSPSVLLAGAAIGVAASILNLIPVAGGCLSCVAFLCSGLLAVWHYTDRHQLTIKGGQGAGIGALAGVVAMAVSSLLSLLFMAVGITPNFRVAMERQFEQSGMDPAQIEEIVGMMSSPLVIAGLVIAALVIYAILGAIGGVIGASVFKRGTDFFEEGPESAPPA